MRNMSIANITSACGGKYIGPAERLGLEISAVTIDSRTVTAGCLFAAIAGEHTDGHRYVSQAFGSGAACALCESLPESAGGPLILVSSVPAALGSIAAFYRQGFNIPFIGITGSVGKTTAKEMTACILAQRYNVHKTAGNFNNELGVPLTLFGVSEENTAAVIEMGISHFGEMSRLTRIVRPDTAIFTLIGYAHTEFLGSRAGVLRAKSEILEGMSSNGTVIANGDDDLLCTLETPCRKLLFGLGRNCDIRAEDIKVLENGSTSCTICGGGKKIEALIPAYGDHMVYAALEGAAAGLLYGLNEEQISRGIGKYEPVGHRARVFEHAGMKIIDDCYNANPTSVLSALRSMTKLGGRMVCILGDMKELGDKSAELHREIGEQAVSLGAELVLAAGEMADMLAMGAGAKGVAFEDTDSLISALSGYLAPGDTVLVKASHSMSFEKVTEELLNM